MTDADGETWTGNAAAWGCIVLAALAVAVLVALTWAAVYGPLSVRPP